MQFATLEHIVQGMHFEWVYVVASKHLIMQNTFNKVTDEMKFEVYFNAPLHLLDIQSRLTADMLGVVGK